MKVVDAHHHVWSLARGDYGWITPAQGPLHRDFSLADYARAAPQVGVSVLVQAAPTPAETRYLLDIAHASAGRVGGVVGWVDLDAEDAPQQLAELARDPLFKSVRPMLQDVDDPEWILRPRVMQALSALPPLGLRFDALVKPRHLLALSRMVEVHSELDVVIDHAAKPDIAAGEWEPWAGALRDLALHPHVHCKLSGLITEAGPDWTIDALSPYVDHVLAHVRRRARAVGQRLAGRRARRRLRPLVAGDGAAERTRAARRCVSGTRGESCGWQNATLRVLNKLHGVV